MTPIIFFLVYTFAVDNSFNFGVIVRYQIWFILTVDELETEGRHAIESPTTPITVTPDTFDLGLWLVYVFISQHSHLNP